MLPTCANFQDAQAQSKRVAARRVQATEMAMKGLRQFEKEEEDRMALEEEEEFMEKDRQQRDLEAEELV